MEKKTPLKNNFLNQVIFRIDFSTILKISGNNKESAEMFKLFHRTKLI